jgi:hypothetical protein
MIESHQPTVIKICVLGIMRSSSHPNIAQSSTSVLKTKLGKTVVTSLNFEMARNQ